MALSSMRKCVYTPLHPPDIDGAKARTPPIQQHLLRPQQAQKRAAHSVPPLAGLEKSFEENGVPGLFSNEGFKQAWLDYQGMITDKLNSLTAGEATYNETAYSLLLRFARDPMNASLFNHASMAYNNHFFFKTLSTAPVHIEDQKVAAVKASLEQTFGSIDTLRTAMLDAASGMFGPGFVWLVWMRSSGSGSFAQRDDQGWRVLTTYNAGTPFPTAAYRLQGLDVNTANAKSFEDYYNAEPANDAGAFGRHTAGGKAEAKIPPGGTQLAPVLCVNTWEHVWLHDFGIKGKRQYLARWWDAIDWYAVQTNMPPEVLRPGFMRR